MEAKIKTTIVVCVLTIIGWLVYNGKERYTASGNQRSWDALHDPATLENIVKAMAKTQRENGSGIFGRNPYGVAVRKFGSIGDLVANEGIIKTLTRDQENAIKTELSVRLSDLVVEYMQTHDRPDDNKFIEHDRALEMMFDAWEQGRGSFSAMKKLLNEWGYSASDDLVKRIKSIFDDISVMPTNYFEAKPQRAVRFDEMKAWIVPDSISEEDRKSLEGNGQSIFTYKTGDEADRLAKVNAAADFANVRFSVAVSPDSFFKPISGDARDVPLASLMTLKNEPQNSIDRAARLMGMASRGETGKRDPIAVADNGDGTYTIVDGNATSRALAAMGAVSARVRVVGPHLGTRFLNSSYLVENVKPQGGLIVEGATDLDKAFAIAVENADQLESIINACAKKVGGEVHMRKVNPETGKPTKTRASAERKARDEYDGDTRKLVDLIGGTVVMEDDGDLNDAVKAITKALPEGASIPKVKKIGFDPGNVGYQDVKVSVKFANGGVGEIILVNRYTYEAKEHRGGHDVYNIERLVKPYVETSSAAEEAYKQLRFLEWAIYSRGNEAPDQAAFERAKENASSSLTRLSLPENATSISERDIMEVKSSSRGLYLAKPPSTSSYTMPASSLMKYMTGTPSFGYGQ